MIQATERKALKIDPMGLIEKVREYCSIINTEEELYRCSSLVRDVEEIKRAGKIYVIKDYEGSYIDLDSDGLHWLTRDGNNVWDYVSVEDREVRSVGNLGDVYKYFIDEYGEDVVVVNKDNIYAISIGVHRGWSKSLGREVKIPILTVYGEHPPEVV